MGEHFKQNALPVRNSLFILVFPTVIFYYETVFRLSTTQGYFHLGTIFMFLFSIAYGGIGYLLSTIARNRTINRIIALSLIGLSALPFLVEYFVYRQFKVFYDIDTMTGGAADAVSGFSQDIFSLLFSWDGLFKILLYILPFVLYLIFGNRFVPAIRIKAKRRIIVAAGMAAVYAVSFLGLSLSNVYGPVYNSEYSFQAAVDRFGLLTGLRLDVQKNLFGTGGDFLETDVPPTEATTSQTTTSTSAPIVYTPNQLDLDLDALKAAASGNLAELDEYVSTLTPSIKNQYTGIFKGKNLIFITAEAFTAEVIDPELTPTLYRLATKGINFTDYYQPASAGTTGGEYQNIFGMMPTSGGKSLKNTANHLNYFTIGNQLNRLGYYGKAFHNNTHTYYDRHKTHINLGYSDGFMGYGNGMENYVKKQWPQSDYEMIAGTLPTYIDKQPFNVYYMTVSGHSGYTRTGNSMTKKHWDRVAHLEYSDTVKGYLAANLELEDAMTYLVGELESKGIADETVICIATDHFPYGLDSDAKLGNMPYLSELYGYSVNNYMQRDHSRLILWCGALEEEEPIVVDSPTFSLDILPTLSNLFGTEYDSRLMPGRDVFSDTEALVFNLNYDWKTEYGTYIAATGKFTPKDETTEIPEGYIKRIKTIVRNKIRYCQGVLNTDYFAHVFPSKQ